MKKLLSIQITFILFAILFQANAQVPEKMSYQAVIRNIANNPVVNASVGIRISILQNSASGTAVYVETQTPTTNSNGLVSLEIGGGNVVTGIFADINWASGTYFIKTETDPTGGADYTIIGTSQLLSVPYALQAKSAMRLGNSIHYVGELYGGGVVFTVSNNGEHGLICSMVNLSLEVEWNNAPTTMIGIDAQSKWDGRSNTNKIVSFSSNSAAGLCVNYTNIDYGTGVYSDWYLPSYYELELIYRMRYFVTKSIESTGNPTTIGFDTNFYAPEYWSSTEIGINYAYSLYFDNHASNSDMSYKNRTHAVRAIRSF